MLFFHYENIIIKLSIKLKRYEVITQECKRKSQLLQKSVMVLLAEVPTCAHCYDRRYPLTVATWERNGYPVNRVKKCFSVSLGFVVSDACPCVIPPYSVVLF